MASFGLTAAGPHSSRAGDPRAGCITPDGVSGEQWGGGQPLPLPSGHVAFDAVKDTGVSGLASSGHVELHVNHFPSKVNLCSQGFFHLSMFGIGLTQVQSLALGLVELLETCTGPALKSAKTRLDGVQK